jgi:hypothetical protein
MRSLRCYGGVQAGGEWNELRNMPDTVRTLALAAMAEDNAARYGHHRQGMPMLRMPRQGFCRGATFKLRNYFPFFLQ